MNSMSAVGSIADPLAVTNRSAGSWKRSFTVAGRPTIRSSITGTTAIPPTRLELVG